MEDRQNHAPLKARKPREDAFDRSLKARNPDLYYENLHIKCYCFCQQYDDHFETTGAKSFKDVSFAAFFVKDSIFFHWQQHKNRIKYDKVAPPSWNEFKAFF